MNAGSRNRSALLVLMVLFASSAALRLEKPMSLSFAFAADEPNAAFKAADQTCPATPTALAEALALREGRVLAQETVLSERQAAIDLAAELLDGRLLELTAAETTLRSTLALADGAAEEDLKKLTQVYENMKPRDAAVLFDAMEPQFAAGFLGRMRAEIAAEVLAGMSTERGYAISAILAGRNTRAPRN